MLFIAQVHPITVIPRFHNNHFTGLSQILYGYQLKLPYSHCILRLVTPYHSQQVLTCMPPSYRSHALTEASHALDNALEEEGAEEGPILEALARFKEALDLGAAEPMELNAGMDSWSRKHGLI